MLVRAGVHKESITPQIEKLLKLMLGDARAGRT